MGYAGHLVLRTVFRIFKGSVERIMSMSILPLVVSPTKGYIPHAFWQELPFLTQQRLTRRKRVPPYVHLGSPLNMDG